MIWKFNTSLLVPKNSSKYILSNLFDSVNYSTNSLNPRRVLFNVPASDERKLKKAQQLNLDSLVFDFEDGVAKNNKDIARETLKNYINKDWSFSKEKLLRTNDVHSQFFGQDIKVFQQLSHKLDGVVLPKVESKRDLESFENAFMECGGSLENKKQKILAAIESAKGIVNLKEIAEYQSHNLELVALIFASEDFAADMGITRTTKCNELLFARSSVVLHARASSNRLQAIDMVCIEYKNEEKLKQECIDGVNMGYDGKQAIHPNQIEQIYKSWYPEQDKLEFAKKILSQNEIHQNKGKGAFEIEGVMIDLPMVKVNY